MTDREPRYLVFFLRNPRATDGGKSLTLDQTREVYEDFLRSRLAGGRSMFSVWKLDKFNVVGKCALRYDFDDSGYNEPNEAFVKSFYGPLSLTEARLKRAEGI
jgi:hypothetical protein